MPTTLTIEQRRLGGRLGALSRLAREGGDAMARTAREGLWRRFLVQVDPNGELSPEEREKRARYAQRAHMIRLAQRAAAKRRIVAS